MADVKTDDIHLQATLDANGTQARVTLGKIKEAVDAYVNFPFNSRKATREEIGKSFDLLHRVYSVTLNAPAEHAIAAIQYLIRRYEAERLGAFHPIRSNMTPNIEKGGSHTSLRFVADLNQLFGALAVCRNATELRARIRLEPIMANVRSETHRETLRQYIASIDH